MANSRSSSRASNAMVGGARPRGQTPVQEQGRGTGSAVPNRPSTRTSVRANGNGRVVVSGDDRFGTPIVDRARPDRNGAFTQRRGTIANP